MSDFVVQFLKLLNAAKDEAIKNGLWSGAFHASCRLFVEGATRNPDNRDEVANIKAQPHHVFCTFSKSKTIVRMGYSFESGTWLIDSGNCRHMSLEKAIEKGILDDLFNSHPFLITFLLHDTDMDRNREMGYEGGAGVGWPAAVITKFAKSMSISVLGEEASDAMGGFNIKGCFTKIEAKDEISAIATYASEFTCIFSAIDTLIKSGAKIRKGTKAGASNKNDIALFQTGIIKGMKEFLTDTQMEGGSVVEDLISDLVNLKDSDQAESVYDLILTTKVRGPSRNDALASGVSVILKRMMKEKSKKEV